jgi:hypothetical protein
MKRPFSESPHIVSGLCESLKTASTYKNRILEQLRTQLGVNPFRRSSVVPTDEHPDAVVADEEDLECILRKNREQQARSSQSV